jgi:hypothetical protein
MFGRALIHEHGADEQIQDLGIGFERYDDLMMSIEWALLRYPEMFPAVPNSRLSICKTNEFVGGEFSEIPSLVIFFYYDEASVRIVAVESNESGSYGL